MNRQELWNRIIALLDVYSDKGLGNCSENSQLIADIGFCSIDIMNIVNDVEDEFDIEIYDNELEDVVTIGDVIKLVEKKLS